MRRNTLKQFRNVSWGVKKRRLLFASSQELVGHGRGCTNPNRGRPHVVKRRNMKRIHVHVGARRASCVVHHEMFALDRRVAGRHQRYIGTLFADALAHRA